MFLYCCKMALSFVKVFYKDQNVRKFIKLVGTTAGDATVFSESDILRSGISNCSLKSYVIANDGHSILQEYQENNTLKDSSRRVLVTLTVNFLRQVCGNYPRREEKESAEKAIISLFPAFKIKDSSIAGHELFFNPINNQGYIATKLKNVNIKQHKLEGTYGSLKKKKLNCENYSNIQAPELDEDTLEFFRNCSVEEQEKIIKAKLKETLIVREEIYQKPIDIFANFPFFFFKPELILYEYELLYSKTADGLLHNWVKYSKVVDEILKETIGEPPLCLDGWSIQPKSFLTLLKLLPSTASGSKSKDIKRPSFEEAINKLVQFKISNISPDKFVFCNTQPWIIAYGPNKTAVSQYYIIILYLMDTLLKEKNTL